VNEPIGRTLHFTVTPEDKAAGQREDCHRCPVALAIQREVGPRWVASVGADGDDTVRLEPVGDWRTVRFFAIPDDLQDRIDHFDENGDWPLEDDSYELPEVDYDPTPMSHEVW
jgi:hypothetical protein